MKYLIVYEKSATGWGAYAPDLPGLGAAGKTLFEVKELIREAVEFHLEACARTAIPSLRPAGCNLLLLLPKVALDMTSQNWDNDHGATAERFR
jgi:predicted RNase H-like HicB family nuclease